ncbi:hypothetical protein PHYSODRAFT_471658 [Phytophthora sojae]|uniref:separase n=1 Tax=Phytophthora sojae (strain P6497) TaxID=1094619 RepID=G4YFA9_PHYSP|nr:hypothetical protein PHYSODRAFT_471658 [Phytophthora sojae]EGZ28335.1 hypothetical protein PHYSODRAFT_471658 [Phytophthora sojae]|eukprot:XP_009515610.1 hypothetical protein PHYSODRAFT_471658 [Phytophthora sojae]
MLGALKATTKQRSTATVVKALGLREMLVHTILSDIHFREGRSTGAIIEAKSALRICWKMAKRFTAASSTVEAAYFDLPSELSATDWQHRKSAHLYFMALESSSWDVLYAAKVSLCRIASLYCYSDQPHRAASYLTEAMRLVGGLNLHLFRRTPFYEFAELELNASHLEKAKTAISMLSSNSRMEPSSALAMVNARCWRKYTRHHSEIIDLSDTSAVETLLNSMKTLKRTLKRCGARLERVKCMLELGRINIKLLRSSSCRAFASLERTISLLEEAYSLGDCLGIAHLSQELRATLGMAYFAEIEESAHGDADRMDGDRARFLSWSSSALLANSCSSTECEMVHELPSSWVIVSLMMGLSSELTNGTAPISFCLPNVSWKSCIDKMDAIVEKSREILSGHTAEEAGSWSTKQKKEWWDTRKQLDERIQKSVRSMEMTLGFWRCLLVKGTSTLETQCVQQCWSLLTSRKVCPVLLAERNQSLLCAIADAQQWLSDGEVVNGLKHIAAEIDVPLSDSGLQEALQTDKIQKMKVSELKQLLAAEGLSTDGLKKVLVERLIAARDAALLEPLTDQAARDQGFSTILILNHQLQQFPWEGMDIMGRSSGVTRMPSLDLTMQNARYVMQSRTSSYSSIRRDRVRFLLNPAGDLKATQNQLGPVLEGGVTTYGWEGIVGEAPDPDKLRNYLLAADLYIYCGHGSGEAYLHRDQVLSLKSGCSAALLFGCSSGRLKREGIFGPSGAVLAYLRAGSPAVLAMLWDVTDRDIDQLSVKILREWLLSEDGDSSPSLARVLQDSRSVCKLKYLNGHAAVCYGLPLHVAKS